MRFGILGPVALWSTDGAPVRVPERKVRALLADLLVHAGQPVSADRLIDDLWGDQAPAGATNALQGKVSQLRRVLDAAEPGGRERLVHGPGGYQLGIADDALDADRFTRMVDHATSHADPAVRAAGYAEALALWRGPVLADFADEAFARGTVRRFREERMVALEAHAEARLELGEHAALVGELTDLVHAHPLRERLRAAHVLALYRGGRQQEALDSYRQLQRHMAEELGLDPGPDLVRLHDAILVQDPDLRSPKAPSSAVVPDVDRPPAQHNLPAPLTELVGRDTALDEVHALLESCRLVTLTGPGGVGKTRLAIAAAHDLDRRRRGAAPTDTSRARRAWMVELGALPPARPEGPALPGVRAGPDAEDVADLVAAAIGMHQDAQRGAAGAHRGSVERLVTALGPHPVLLLIDNCEHVLDSVAEFAARVLAAAPQVCILATSREPLGVPGEMVWSVPALATPGASTTAPDALATFGAVQLFVARAAGAEPGFAFTDENAPAVAAICRHLDGVPLALELAATQVRTLGVQVLSERLGDRFRLLSASKRGVPARQRTLRAVIDWSWQLLSQEERAVLRRLTVHAEGFSLASAVAVCRGDPIADDDVPDLLARLVERSLVTVRHGSATRYRLLESITAYGLERLEAAGEAERVRRGHRQHYLDLAQQAEPFLRGPDQGAWLRRLDVESANLRRALDGAIEDHDAEAAQRLVVALAWYWYVRGRPSEACRSLARAMDVAGPVPAAVRVRSATWHAGIALLAGTGRARANDAVLEAYLDLDDPRGRAHAQWLLGHAEASFGDLSASERLIDDVLETFRALDDEWGIAACLGSKARQAVFRNDLAGLRAHAEESLARFGAVGDGWGQLVAIDALATHHEIVGDYGAAITLIEHGARLAEELQLWAEQSTMWSRMGRIALLRGQFAHADALHERARELALSHANGPSEEMAEFGLALSARRQGRLDDAEAILRRWLAWNRRVEADHGVALLQAELGFVAELRGDAEAAMAAHVAGLDAARATGDVRAVALAFEGLAGAESLAGRHADAARLLGVADGARAAVDAPLPEGERGDVDRITARTQTALGAGEFARQFRVARAERDEIAAAPRAAPARPQPA